MGKKKPTTEALPEVPWHSLPLDEVVTKLNTNLETGLTVAEAKKRLDEFGENALPKKRKIPAIVVFLLQFHDVLIYLLIAVMIVCFVMQQWPEGIVIFIVVIINAIIGFVQEYKADKASEALDKLLSLESEVVRSSVRTKIGTNELVPGDIVIVQSGDKVPADCRVFDVNQLHTEEAALTGETTANPKFVCMHDVDTVLGDRSNMLFSSTYVAKGTGTAVCVETGVRTEIGKISSMVANVKQEKTPLTRQMTQFGHILVIITLVLIVIAFLCVKFVHFQEISWGGAFLYGASIGVAVVPEGLPAIVSLTLAIGMQRMAKQKALIRSMPAVETTGAVSVICSDKTGTLTTNQMTARSILTYPQKFQVSGTGYDPVDGEVIPVDTAITLNDPVPDPNDAYTLTIQSGTEAGKKLLEQQMQFEQWKKDNAEYMPLQGFDVNAKPDVVNNPRKSLDPRLQKTSVLTSQLLRCGVLCNDSVIVRNQEDRLAVQGDTTEGSLFPLAVKIGMNTNEVTRKNKRIHVIPFESDYGFMATANDCPVTEYSSAEEKASGDKTNHMIFLKGAPEKVFNLCKFQANVNDEGEVVVEEMDKQFWLDETEKIAAVGLRTLGLAHRFVSKERFGEQIVETEKRRHDEIDGEKKVDEEEPKLKKGAPLNFEDITDDFIMLGVVGIFDPPRKESKRAIRKCRRARIKVVMITGDHAKTAAAIGGLLGLDPATVKTSVDLKEMSDEELKVVCENTQIYARATPADKLRIVQALQSNGHIVAMTGDGVNDAPALKQAHAGIAMGINGTEVAKEASKLVLLDDNFATIVKAVEEGRKVYDSLKRSITYILPTNMAEGMSLFIAAFISWVPPITPLQILWINSITSVALSSLIPFQRGEQNVLARPPRDTKKMLLTSTILIRTVYIGLFIASMIICYFYLMTANPDPLDPETRRHSAMAVNTIVLCEITFLLNSVYLKESSVTPRVFRDVGVPSLISFVILIGLQFMLTYVPGLNTVFGMGPMYWWQWFICLGAAVLVFILAEIEKAIRRCCHRQSAKRKALKGTAGVADLHEIPDDESESDEESGKKKRRKKKAAAHNEMPALSVPSAENQARPPVNSGTEPRVAAAQTVKEEPKKEVKSAPPEEAKKEAKAEPERGEILEEKNKGVELVEGRKEEPVVEEKEKDEVEKTEERVEKKEEEDGEDKKEDKQDEGEKKDEPAPSNEVAEPATEETKEEERKEEEKPEEEKKEDVPQEEEKKEEPAPSNEVVEQAADESKEEEKKEEVKPEEEKKEEEKENKPDEEEKKEEPAPSDEVVEQAAEEAKEEEKPEEEKKEDTPQEEKEESSVEKKEEENVDQPATDQAHEEEQAAPEESQS